MSRGKGKNLKQKKRGLIPKAFGTAAAIVGKHPKCGAEVLPHGVFNPRGVRSKRKADDIFAH